MVQGRVAVVGAGLMGHGIAQACATAGHDVTLIDTDATALERALGRIEANLTNLGTRLPAPPGEVLARISTSLDVSSAVRGAAIVIEAVPEDLALKRDVFATLDRSTDGETILATNTASLRISSIAEATERPERVIGTHWLFPPYLIPLVEVIPGEATSPEVLERTKTFLRGVGKIPSQAADIPGFVMIRMLHAFVNEAVSLLESGAATAQDIDNSFRLAWGIPFLMYGPLLAHDVTVNKAMSLSVATYLEEQTGHAKFRAPDLLRQKVANGELGLIAGKGWYDFEGSDAAAIAARRDALLVRMLDVMEELGLVQEDPRAILEPERRPRPIGDGSTADGAPPTAPDARPKVVHMDEAPTRPMRDGRGTQYRLVGPEDGARAIDVHLNVLNADSGPGPYHVHDRTENVYIVLEGTARAVVDGRELFLGPGQVAFIPPGVPHLAGSDGSGVARVIEIYAPAGTDFRILSASGLPEAASVEER